MFVPVNEDFGLAETVVFSVVTVPLPAHVGHIDRRGQAYLANLCRSRPGFKRHKEHADKSWNLDASFSQLPGVPVFRSQWPAQTVFALDWAFDLGVQHLTALSLQHLGSLAGRRGELPRACEL